MNKCVKITMKLKKQLANNLGHGIFLLNNYNNVILAQEEIDIAIKPN